MFEMYVLWNILPYFDTFTDEEDYKIKLIKNQKIFREWT